MRDLSYAAILCTALASLHGCGCMSHVTVTNHTDMQMLADVSLPYPGYGLFRSHCQFTILMQPGQTWDSRATRREERVELPTGPHGSMLVRLVNLDMKGWPHVVYSITAEEIVHVSVAGDWQSLLLEAANAHGDPLEVWREDQRQWFGDVTGDAAGRAEAR